MIILDGNFVNNIIKLLERMQFPVFKNNIIKYTKIKDCEVMSLSDNLYAKTF